MPNSLDTKHVTRQNVLSSCRYEQPELVDLVYQEMKAIDLSFQTQLLSRLTPLHDLLEVGLGSITIYYISLARMYITSRYLQQDNVHVHVLVIILDNLGLHEITTHLPWSETSSGQGWPRP